MTSLSTSTISNNNLTTPTFIPNTELKAVEMPTNTSAGMLPAPKVVEMPTNTSAGTLPVTKAAKPRKQFKKLKDPEAPRRPLSPYMLFVKEERTKIVAEMGGMVAIGEVGKEMGRRWSLMDQQERKKYDEMYKEDKVRYEEQMKTYQPSKQFLETKMKHDMVMQGGDKTGTAIEKQEIAWTQWSTGKMIEGNKPKKVKKIVDPEAPRKPLTAFFLFQKKMRKGGLAANAKGLADMWKNMEEEGKKIYKEEEVELRKKYSEEVLQYRNKTALN